MKISFVLVLLFVSLSSFALHNDPFLKKQWSFHSKDAKKPGSSIYLAHKATEDLPRKEVIVAVIDTGVDYTHEDIAKNIWININEIPNNGIDDDNNGYIDDIHGIDLIDNDSDPQDAYDHGTHVAGIIAAETNNNIGISGIALNAKIMAIRAIPNKGDEEDDVVIKALLYSAQNGAKIINCSFTKAESSIAVSDAIDMIHDLYDVLVVTTAGNSHVDIDEPQNFTYPAHFANENLITVASCSSRESVSYFSSWGEVDVDIFAPGSISYSLKPGNKYQSMNGTSQAAPVVSGIAAELWSLFPNLTAVEIKNIILNTSTKSNSLMGKSKTGGRVDLYLAVSSLLH